MDTDSFVLSMKTETIVKALKGSQEMFDFTNLDEKHELFSIKNKM